MFLSRFRSDCSPDGLQTILAVIPVVTSFLPWTNTDLYIPALFKLWEALNSTSMDERMLELGGCLSEEHVAGKAGIAGDSAAGWKDVGIWTQEQWTLLLTKGLSAMSTCCLRLSMCLLIDVSCRCSYWPRTGNRTVQHMAIFSVRSNVQFERVRVVLRPMLMLWRTRTLKESRRISVNMVSIENMYTSQ